MNDLNDSQQKLAEELVKLVMQRVYIKLAPKLNDSAMQRLEELTKEDETGEKATEFLMSKFPDFNQMFEQEVEALKLQLTSRNP
jgi:hypothetical protein